MYVAEWIDRKYVDGNDRLAGSIGSIWAFRVDYGLEKASLLGASADSWKPLLGGNAHYFKAIVSG